MLTDKQKIVVSTGNILNANKKAGQKTTEEVSNFHYFIYIQSYHGTKSHSIKSSSVSLISKLLTTYFINNMNTIDELVYRDFELISVWYLFK